MNFKKIFKWQPFSLLLLVIISTSTSFAQPFIANHTITTPIADRSLYNKLELGIDLDNWAGNNPYNWDEIQIRAILTYVPTSTQYIAYGFYYEDFTIGASACPQYQNQPIDPITGFREVQTAPPGNGNIPTVPPSEFLVHQNTDFEWRVRFAPPHVGTWQYEIQLFHNGTQIGSQSSEPFTIGPSNNRGFILKRSNTGSFPNSSVGAGAYEFTDGTIYFPTGSNLELYKYNYCRNTWDIHGSQSYLRIIDRLNDVNANFARLLLTGNEWGTRVIVNNPADPNNGNVYRDGFTFNIEDGPTTNLGNYDAKQNIAFLLDQLVEYTNERGINLQLALTTWAEIGDWRWNPFSQITKNVGGQNIPIDAVEYFTNPTAIALQKRKYQYIAARWGYATNIFAWEVLTETEILNGLKDLNGNSTPPKPIDVINWITTMSQAIKNIDPNHLTLASTANEYREAPSPLGSTIKNSDIYSINDVDIIDHHTYKSTPFYNGSHYKREHLINKILDHYKPTLAGEFGRDGVLGETLLGTTNNDMNYDVAFHNVIWSSSFSGQSGTSSYWSSGMFFNSGPIFRHIAPLRTLIDVINFENEDFIPITTSCSPPTATHLAMSSSTKSWFNTAQNFGGHSTLGPSFSDDCPSFNGGVFNSSIDLISAPGGPTDLESKVSVFGLQGQENIYGWIHKKDNFWWKVPHLGWTGNAYPGGQTVSWHFDENCAFYLGDLHLNPPGTTPPSPIPSPADCHNEPLSGVDAVFNDVCNGEYYIDYYATYPTQPNGFNGGIIPDFTRRLFSGNNDLHVKIPMLAPIVPDQSSDFAPDYGYNIRQVVPENYKYIKIGNWIPYEQATSNNIETFYTAGQFVTKIFFRGPNGHMYYYGYIPSTQTWGYGPVNGSANGPGPNEVVNGDIAINNFVEDQVFFRGVDKRLHTYQFVGTQPGSWQHGCLSGCNSPSAEFVHSDCTIEAMDDKVVYRGENDDLLHMYYKNGTSWSHALFNPNATGPSEKVGTYISIPNDPHASPDVVFFINHNLQIGMYTRNGSNAAPWTYSAVSPLNPPAGEEWYFDPITSGYVDGELYVFYRGANGMVQFYRQNNFGTWVHGQLSNNINHSAMNGTNLLFKDEVLYYYSASNSKINRYYWDGAEWRHSFISTCTGNNPPNPNNMYNFRFTSDGNIVYIDLDNYVKMLWNQETCDKCPYTDNVPHYKQTKKEEQLDTYQVNGEITKFVSNDNIYRLMIYPNPALDYINIKFDNKTKHKTVLKLVNILGMTVKDVQLDEGINSYRVPVSELPRGLYYINISELSGKMITTQKVTLH